MSRIFKREVENSSLIESLKKEKLFEKKLMDDVKKGEVFAAFRGDKITFYRYGNVLFHYDKNGFQTHYKFAIEIPKSTQSYFTQRELGEKKDIGFYSDFYEHYSDIKKNLEEYSKNEKIAVANLYKFNLSTKTDIALIDIEIQWSGNDDRDRIDALLYNKIEKKLKFVEAKYSSARGVKEQAHNYSTKVNQEKIKNSIIKTYNKVIANYEELFGGEKNEFGRISPCDSNTEIEVNTILFNPNKNVDNQDINNIVVGESKKSFSINIKKIWDGSNE